MQSDDPLTTAMAAAVVLAGLGSMYYHWAQLHYGPNVNQVRKALLVDYFTASIAVFCSAATGAHVVWAAHLHDTSLPEPFLLGLSLGIIGTGALLVSWIKEGGEHYLLWHGLWHICGGVCNRR